MPWNQTQVRWIYSRSWCWRNPPYVFWMFGTISRLIQSWFILEFYFNFKDSFYGEIEALSASGRRTLPHLGFLATPLLPCGRFDDPVRKFTGSDNLGPADDNLTQAIHAFVHFAWVYSREQLLFCDMQGLPTLFITSSPDSWHLIITGTRNRKKVMCLIDPQAHTQVLPVLSYSQTHLTRL